MVAALMGIVGSAMLRIVDVRPLTAAAQSARTVSEVLAVWGGDPAGQQLGPGPTPPTTRLPAGV